LVISVRWSFRTLRGRCRPAPVVPMGQGERYGDDDRRDPARATRKILLTSTRAGYSGSLFIVPTKRSTEKLAGQSSSVDDQHHSAGDWREGAVPECTSARPCWPLFLRARDR